MACRIPLFFGATWPGHTDVGPRPGLRKCNDARLGNFDSPQRLCPESCWAAAQRPCRASSTSWWPHLATGCIRETHFSTTIESGPKASVMALPLLLINLHLDGFTFRAELDLVTCARGPCPAGHTGDTYSMCEKVPSTEVIMGPPTSRHPGRPSTPIFSPLPPFLLLSLVPEFVLLPSVHPLLRIISPFSKPLEESANVSAMGRWRMPMVQQLFAAEEPFCFPECKNVEFSLH